MSYSPPDRTSQVWEDGGYVVVIVGPPFRHEHGGWAHPIGVLSSPAGSNKPIRHSVENYSWSDDRDMKRML